MNKSKVIVWSALALIGSGVAYFITPSEELAVAGVDPPDPTHIQTAPVIHQCPIHDHAGLHITMIDNCSYGSPYWICPDDWLIRWHLYPADACSIDNFVHQIFKIGEETHGFSIRPRTWWEEHVDDWGDLMEERDYIYMSEYFIEEEVYLYP